MIRVLVAGYGYWGSVMSQNLVDHPDFFLTAIQDVDAERLNAAAGKNIHAYKYLEEAIDKTHPEVLFVCTPIERILETACVGLTRYIDVMACKPGATSTKEYQHIVSVADKHNRRYTVDYTTLAAPSFPLLQERLAGRHIKRIEAIRAATQQRSNADIIDDLVVHDAAMITELIDTAEPDFIKAERTATRASMRFNAAGTEVNIIADRRASNPARVLRIETGNDTITYEQVEHLQARTPVQARLDWLSRVMRQEDDSATNRITARNVLHLTDRMKVEAA